MHTALTARKIKGSLSSSYNIHITIISFPWLTTKLPPHLEKREKKPLFSLSKKQKLHFLIAHVLVVVTWIALMERTCVQPEVIYSSTRQSLNEQQQCRIWICSGGKRKKSKRYWSKVSHLLTSFSRELSSFFTFLLYSFSYPQYHPYLPDFCFATPKHVIRIAAVDCLCNSNINLAGPCTWYWGLASCPDPSGVLSLIGQRCGWDERSEYMSLSCCRPPSIRGRGPRYK